MADGSKKLYIMTIGVLVAYRQRGVGRKLLNLLLDAAAKMPEIARHPRRKKTSRTRKRKAVSLCLECPGVAWPSENARPVSLSLCLVDRKRERKRHFSPRRDLQALVYLHVQTSNEGALDFYNKAGFEKIGKIENYYKRITHVSRRPTHSIDVRFVPRLVSTVVSST